MVTTLDAGDHWCLVPPNPELRECLRLIANCRQLAGDMARGGRIDSRLPAVHGVRWHSLTGVAPVPLPMMPAPAGVPLDRWVTGGAAALGQLLQIVSETGQLVAELAQAGMQIGTLALDEIWVQDGRVTWLPAALAWQRTSRVATGRNLWLAARATGGFLRLLLQAGRDLPGMGTVWEELWALAHDLLERGYGLTAAGAWERLERLKSRTAGAEEPFEAPPEVLVVVDAYGLGRRVGLHYLDVAGLLWTLLQGRRAEGVMVGAGRLANRWAGQARECGLRWIEAPQTDLGLLTSLYEESGVDELLLLTGAHCDVSDQLNRLFPRAGRVAFLEQKGTEELPERWIPALWPGGLHHWWRLRNPGNSYGR